jgi:hypothetical protein
MWFRAGIVLGATLLMGACSNSSNSLPTSPSGTSTSSTATTATTERFDAIIEPGGSAFYSFQISSTGGPIAINLASMSPLDRPGLLPVVMDIGYGAPAGEACIVTRSVRAAPGLTAQLTDTLTSGIYCARIADVGNLKEPANYSIRITHP